jgi:sarcosine oxidase subunit beta
MAWVGLNLQVCNSQMLKLSAESGGASRGVAPRDRSRHLPALRSTAILPRAADVVVVGGGVVGAATAFFAARAGLATVVLERRPALGTQSTAAATGAFRLQFDNAEELELVKESVELFLHFPEATGLDGWDLELHRGGYLWVATEAETAARQRERVERQRAWGLDDVELLRGVEVRGRFPFLAPEVLQARHRAGDGWLSPRRLTIGFARASGAVFVLGAEALELEVSGARVTGVRTDRGRIQAGAVVVAAGNFSAGLAGAAGVTLPLASVRRHRLVIQDVPEAPAHAPMTIDEETGAHWRPAPGGAHVMWPDPAEAPQEPLEDVPSCEAFAFRVLDPASRTSVARISPFWRTVWERGTSPWMLRAGQYDITPDHRPLLGATALPGLYVNCGYSGHGVMASAGGSRLTVDALLGRLDPDRNPFRPDRAMAPRARDVL